MGATGTTGAAAAEGGGAVLRSLDAVWALAADPASSDPAITQALVIRRIAGKELAIDSPILFERKLAVVLPEKTQEPLVVARLHVEQTQDNPVVASGFLQPLSHEIPDLITCDFAPHVERIDRRPERFPILDQSSKKVIGNSDIAHA